MSGLSDHEKAAVRRMAAAVKGAASEDVFFDMVQASCAGALDAGARPDALIRDLERFANALLDTRVRHLRFLEPGGRIVFTRPSGKPV